MTVKDAAKKTGNGVLTALSFVATAAHDGPRKERIEEIDKAIEEMQEERARLVAELIDPTGI